MNTLCLKTLYAFGLRLKATPVLSIRIQILSQCDHLFGFYFLGIQGVPNVLIFLKYDKRKISIKFRTSIFIVMLSVTLIHIILNCLQNNEDLSHAGSIYVALVKLTVKFVICYWTSKKAKSLSWLCTSMNVTNVSTCSSEHTCSVRYNFFSNSYHVWSLTTIRHRCFITLFLQTLKYRFACLVKLHIAYVNFLRWSCILILMMDSICQNLGT